MKFNSFLRKINFFNESCMLAPLTRNDVFSSGDQGGKISLRFENIPELKHLTNHFSF